MWILEGAEEKYVLGCGTWTVGRVDCNIILAHDLSISRKHAVLTVTPEGELMIQDHQSKYGTFLSGIRIEGRMIIRPHEAESHRVLRFGGVKSEFGVRGENWQTALIGRVEKGALIPRNELSALGDAQLIVLGDGYMQECGTEELLGLALAWVKKVPIVTATFLDCLPRVPSVSEHSAVMPFSPKRLEQCSGIYCPGREELIRAFGGVVSSDPRDAIEEALLGEFLYERRPDLPQSQRKERADEPVVYGPSKVNVVITSLFRKQLPIPNNANNTNSAVNTKRFKKVQPERALPVIVDLIENVKSPLQRKVTPRKGEFEEIKTGGNNSAGRRKRKLPVFEDYQAVEQQPKTEQNPKAKASDSVSFQSDFFKNL